MRVVISMVAVVALSACVQQQFWVKNAVTYDRYERDFVGCQTVATQSVPTNTQVAWAPYVGVYSVDTNSALPTKNFELCMRDKGYSQVALQPCTGADLEAARNQMTRPQDRSRTMQIGPKSCYTLKADGSPFLHTSE